MFLAIRNRGFTLVEVIIAIAIFGILSLPIINLQISSIRSNRESNEQILATNLAEGKIEELKYEKEIKLGEQVLSIDQFEMTTNVELVDRKDITQEEKEGINSNELYKIRVVVKKDDKVMQDLTTYNNSLEMSD